MPCPIFPSPVNCLSAPIFYPRLNSSPIPGGSDSKEFACNAEDPGSIPGLGRSSEKGTATHFSILAWRVPWTEEPCGLQSMGSQSQTQLSHEQIKSSGLLQNGLPIFSSLLLISNVFTSLMLVLSCVQLFSTPWTVACQAPLSGSFQARILEWVAISYTTLTTFPTPLLPWLISMIVPKWHFIIITISGLMFYCQLM